MPLRPEFASEMFGWRDPLIGPRAGRQGDREGMDSLVVPSGIPGAVQLAPIRELDKLD
jgi:hypothetical protein